MKSPGDVVADIRRKYRVDMPVGDDDPVFDIAVGVLPLVGDELYESRTHFFTELLQNADDNAYAASAVPALTLTARPGVLELLNNETGFEERHVRALCCAGKSTKKDRKETATGEKGIGFKAVFQVSDRPEIHSNGYHFRFDKNREGGLGTVIPEWVAPASDNEGTRIILPLREGFELPFDFLKSLQPELLLFLRRLKRVEFRNEAFGQSLALQRHDEDGAVEVVRTLVDEVDKSRCSEQRHRFRVHKLPVSMADIAEQRRSNIASSEVAIAFALDWKEEVDVESTRDLFAFLRVKDSGLRFLAHGDFVLASSREAVREAQPWNIRLRDALGDCLAEAVLACRGSVSPGATALRVLSDPKTVPDRFLREILARGISSLRDQECVPAMDGTWVRPSDAIMTDAYGLWRLVAASDAISLLGKRFVDPAPSTIESALTTLGVARFNLDSLLACIKNDEWRNSRTTSWFGALYATLGRAQLSDRQLDLFRNAPVLRLEAGETVCPKVGTVFRSLGGDVRYGFEGELQLLDPAVLESLTKEQKDYALELLARLEVAEATVNGIIERHILKVHGGRAWQVCADDQMIGHARYLRDHFKAYINNKPPDRRQAAESEVASKLKILRSGEGDKERYAVSSSLYLGQAYRDPHDLEGLFGASIAGQTVSAAYASQTQSEGSDTVALWREFFISIGAKTLPDVYWSDNRTDYAWGQETDQVLNSGPDATKNRLLEIIDRHWASRYSAWKNRPESPLGASGPSKILLALRKTVVPTSVGPAPLASCFTSSEENRAVFGDQVPYLTFSLSSEFAGALGVVQAPMVSNALARIVAIRQSGSDLDSMTRLLGPLYRFLEQRFDQHAQEILAAFRNGPLVLGEGAGGQTWAKLGDCCWTLPREVRPFTKVIGLSNHWRDFQGFFCEKLGVEEGLNGGRLVDVLVALKDSKSHGDQTTRVARMVYSRLRPLAAGVDESEAGGTPRWLQRLRGECLLLTKSGEWWCSEGDLFAADDRAMEALFAQAKSIAFIDLLGEDLTSHGKFLLLVDIPKLSAAIHVTVPEDVKSAPWEVFDARLYERLRAITRLLHHKHPQALDIVIKSGAFKAFSQLKGRRCDLLELDVKLHKDFARKAFNARIVADGDCPWLYVDASAESDWDAVSIELGRLLNLSDTESLSIGKILEKPTMAEVEKFLDTLHVADLPVEIATVLFGDEDSAPTQDDSESGIGGAADAGSGTAASEPPGNASSGNNPGQRTSGASDQSTDANGGKTESAVNGSADKPATTANEAGSSVNSASPPVGPIRESDSRGDTGTTPNEAGAYDATSHQEDGEDDREEDGNGLSDDDTGTEEDADDDFDDEFDEDRDDDGVETRVARSQEGSQTEEHQLSGSNGSGPGKPPTEPDRPGRKRRRKGKNRGSDERMRSYVAPDNSARDEAERGGLSPQERAQIEAAAIRCVLDWERSHGRNPKDMNEGKSGNKGFDVLSNTKDGKVERYIEVKGVKGFWSGRGVDITPAQFNFAMSQGRQAWLYIVENALSEQPHIYSIQDFARRVWRFGFDDGWKAIAASEKAESLPVPVKGMRIRVKTDGRGGVVTKTFGAGMNQGVEVLIDESRETVRVLWQPDRIVLVATPEDV